MMMMRSSIRRLSTRPIVDRFFNVLQSSSEDERQTKLGSFIDTYLQQGDMNYPNLINDVIHRWAIEQPTRDALWTCESNTNECRKLTFHDVYKQSLGLANALSGTEFNLTPGKTVLVILPEMTEERVLLQLACLRSDLIFCSYNANEITNVGILQRIQKLAADCIITNEDSLELVRKYIHNPLRPLKKGLIIKRSTSEPLPVGWKQLTHSANDTESHDTKVTKIRPNTPVIRVLSNNNMLEYSQENFHRRLILTALWFNINRTSDLIWMKNQNEIISIAPWLFGSTIFYKQSNKVKEMLNTFQKHPIDTLCASSADYQMLENQPQHENKTHLKQLYSSEPIDPIIKGHWHSLTNLHIRDNYADINDQSMLKDFLKYDEKDTRHADDQYQMMGNKYSMQQPMPLKKFAYL